MQNEITTLYYKGVPIQIAQSELDSEQLESFCNESRSGGFAIYVRNLYQNSVILSDDYEKIEDALPLNWIEENLEALSDFMGLSDEYRYEIENNNNLTVEDKQYFVEQLSEKLNRSAEESDSFKYEILKFWSDMFLFGDRQKRIHAQGVAQGDNYDVFVCYVGEHSQGEILSTKQLNKKLGQITDEIKDFLVGQHIDIKCLGNSDYAVSIGNDRIDENDITKNKFLKSIFDSIDKLSVKQKSGYLITNGKELNIYTNSKKDAKIYHANLKKDVKNIKIKDISNGLDL